MAEIIPNFGEVRLSLKEYNDMRDEIRSLREDNDALVEERDQICDENKVRVRRQIIKITELTYNPHAVGTREIIDDRLVNLEDVKAELTEQYNEKQKHWQRELDQAFAEKESATRMLEQCQRQKLDAEMEVRLLKSRNWWQRLRNKY